METIPHNQPFTEYDLNLAWREFAAQLPREENAIAKRMMGMKLILKENAEFEVLVENGMIEKYMQDIKQRVLAGLRTKLKNSQISMSIRVSEATEVVRAYGPVQQFQAMSQKNPGLLKLREEFGLELD